MYERASAVFIHSGTVLGITGGVGHAVKATSGLIEKSRLARGKVGEDPLCEVSQPYSKIRCGGGQTLELWSLSAGPPYRSWKKGLANSCPIKPDTPTSKAEERRRWRTEYQRASGAEGKRPEDVVVVR